MEFVKTEDGMVMHQHKYALEILGRFEMNECNSVSNPCETNSKLEECSDEEIVHATMYKQLVGSLRYLCNSMPDLCYAVGVVSKFMNEPRKPHLIAAKRILRYVKGTVNYSVLFPEHEAKSAVKLVGYSDSDWCGDRIDSEAMCFCIMVLQLAGLQRSNQLLHYPPVKQNM
jgi:hypothetical protein